jgi:hypothetical protein
MQDAYCQSETIIIIILLLLPLLLLVVTAVYRWSLLVICPLNRLTAAKGADTF